MKFIDLFKAKDKRSPRRRRLEDCPHPKGCYPVAYNMGSNNAGCCVGLIDTVKHLDCVRLCIFYKKLPDGGIYCSENFMTPDEAVDQAKCLLSGVSCALEYASSYQEHHKHLCQLRDAGDKTPGEGG